MIKSFSTKKHGVIILKTEMEIIDCLDFVELRYRTKKGCVCRVLPKKTFCILIDKCIEDFNLKIDVLVKQYHSPKYGHYIPYEVLENEKKI